MDIILSISILLTLFYGVLLLRFLLGWYRVPLTHIKEGTSNLKVSIVIAARNEEANIERCLRAVKGQDYPQENLEVILVDDASTDSTRKVAEGVNGVRVIASEGALKKGALETGIRHATGQLIVTTDADCTMGPHWISSLVSYKEATGHKMISAPVVFEKGSGFLAWFQGLDFMGMVSMGAASMGNNAPLMCNGANLCYEKKAFEEVGGFSGVDHIASGDDMLLLHKMAAAYHGQVSFLKNKETMVLTQGAKGWGEFIAQRVRWSSKSFHYKNKLITFSLFLVYLFNLSLPVNFVLGFYFPDAWTVLASQLGVKIIADYLLLSTASRFFGRKELLWLFLPAQLAHIFYVLVVGLLGVTTSYTWKERVVR